MLDVNEYSDEDVSIVDKFKIKKTLSNTIFDDYNKMHENVRKKLLEIADEFIEYIGIKFFIHDIVLSGSLATYNWSEYSDLDLHIMVDFENSKYGEEMMKEFFSAKRTAWNNLHEIKIKNIDVELYVQDVNEEHVSSGIYSILKNKWITKPEIEKPKINKTKILQKSDDFINQYNKLLKKSQKKDVSNDIDKLIKKLQKFRKCGLSKNGEFSYENLTFKLLRRNGYIEKFIDLKNNSIDKKLSIK